MVYRVRSLGLSGVEGYEVSVECDLSSGLPSFEIVGLPDAAVKEARERVRAACKNCGFSFPVSRITVNLAPAARRKAGTVYDLPILMGLLCAGGQLKGLPEDAAFVGELSLSGKVRPVAGMLPMALSARAAGIRTLFVPRQCAAEATLAQEVTVYGVSTVQELVEHLAGRAALAPTPVWTPEEALLTAPDFSEVKGQEQVKRALEIAAAGGHNVLMIGPPGSGKSMLARRLPSILPDMTRQEALESTGVHSVMGLTSSRQPLLLHRPFRAPHHTVSPMGMAGGGTNPRPGEISLAHNGVLFLDELPEFRADVLEVLRQPLEDGVVTISRAAGSVRYPARFMLVCAMNPCKCGWYGHPSGRCKCSQAAVERYQGRVSGPLLDRMDLHVEVPSLEFDELSHGSGAETSAQIRLRVNAARALQSARFGPGGPSCNAHMGQKELREFCRLDEAGERLMHGAFDRLGLTARGYDRILRVGRTVADLDGSETIRSAHLAEALQYRASDYLKG